MNALDISKIHPGPSKMVDPNIVKDNLDCICCKALCIKSVPQEVDEVRSEYTFSRVQFEACLLQPLEDCLDMLYMLLWCPSRDDDAIDVATAEKQVA